MLPRQLEAWPAHGQVVSRSSINLPHPHQLPNALCLPPSVSMCRHLLNLVLPILGVLPPSTPTPHHQDPDGEIDRWGFPPSSSCRYQEGAREGALLMTVDNPYLPIPKRPTTRIADASFISRCYMGQVDFFRSPPPPAAMAREA